MSGKPGRYISIEKGPMADSTPRMRMMKKRLFFGAVIRKGEVTQMDTILIIGAGAAGLMAAYELS